MRTGPGGRARAILADRKRAGRIRLLLLLSAAVLISWLPTTPAQGQAILNVERLGSPTGEGWAWQANGRLNLARGNTDLLQVGVNLGLGFMGPRHWLRAFSGVEYLDKNDRALLDNRYLHLRYNLLLSPSLRTFHFLQLQTNRNLLLEQRFLLGTGIRGTLLGGGDGAAGGLEAGLGFMYEMERLRRSGPAEVEPGRTHTLRMSNLLVGSWSPGEKARLKAIVYHQPDIRKMRDYRLLAEAAAIVPLASSLDLEISLDWRHDSRAPDSLREDDLGLRTGITYRTR